MDESQFIEFAETALKNIFDAIEEADEEFTLDADLLDGILTIELPDGGEYVINKHDSSKEIWLSSPISGASHFSYDENEEMWLDSDDNDLFETLITELEMYVALEF